MNKEIENNKTIKASAKRQAIYRMRRKLGLHYVEVELTSENIYELIRRNYLEYEDRNKKSAIMMALNIYLNLSLKSKEE